jgi:hypothetical protein
MEGVKEILVSSLKLCESEALPGFMFLADSLCVPGSRYYIEPEKAEVLNRQVGDASIAAELNSDPALWLSKLVGCDDLEDFEALLFSWFSTVSVAMIRLAPAVQAAEASSGSCQWIEPGSEIDRVERAVLSGRVGELPPLSNAEVLTFADYDQGVALLEGYIGDKALVRKIYLEVLRVLSADGVTFDSTLNVLFANLMLALRELKYAEPDESRTFLTHVMKGFIQGIGGSEI